ncbi:MAG: hypothetical protein IOD08_30465, partial [Bradyrhizobium sp.]|uniref:beta strand repeat-containing protein n=1 Tax=Bradyrhizobium sp. TaxID=376 RepID=UPI0025C37B56
TGTHTIDRRPLTYSIANSTSIYGTVGAATLSNIVNGDDVAAIVRPMRAGPPGGPFDLAATTDRVVGGLGGYRTTVTGLTGAARDNYEVAGSGNTDGRHEITARPVTFAIANSSSIYGDTPTPGAVTLAGILPGDAANVAWTVGVTGPSPGATATTLSATSSAGDYTRAVFNLTGTRAFNYVVDPANSTPGTHTVDRRLLTVTLTGTVTKAYDGFTDVNNLTTANFQLGNFAAGEGAGSTVTRRSGFYTGTADVGTGKEVRVSLGDGDFQLSNANASNYNLPSTNALGNIGAITQRTLTATLVGAISRTYDGTRAATVASSNFALSGFARGQGATVNRTVAEFDSRDAGAGKTVTVRDLVAADFTPTGATNLANYVLPTTLSAAIGRIVEKELTVSGVTAASRPYDGTATATLTGGAISQATGLVAGDTVTLATTTVGTFATRNAGEAIQVTPTGFSISGADARNYNLIQPTPTANITRREIVVTGVTADSKTYDGTTAATLRGGTLSGVLSGDSVTIAGGVGTFADRNVGAGIGVTATALTLSGPDGGNYAVALPTGLTADIRARTLTASLTGAISKTYDGTTAATLGSANVALSGFAAGENATLTRTTAAFDRADAGTGKTVTITGLTAADFTAASGTRLGNYVLPTAASGTGGTIVAAPLTVTPANLSRVYGAADPALTFTATGFVAGETAALLTGALTRAAGDDAGSYAIGQGTLAAGGNYEIRVTPGTFTIIPAALTVTVADATRVYGDANPAFTLAVTGFVAPRSGAAVDTAAVLTSAPVVSTEATGTSAVGSYAIAASGGAAANYRFAYRPGTLQITPAQLTVTANPVSKAYGAADPALTFAAAGLKNAETAATVLTGSLLRAPGAGVGSYAIGQGTLAANANYALTYVPAAFVITPAQLSYAIANTRATYGSVASVGPVTFTGLVAGETVTPTIQVRNAQNQTVTLAAGTPAGAYTAAVTAIGGAAAANYTLATTGNSNGLLTIDRANLGVAVGLGQLPPAGAALARPVGAPNPAVVYALTGLVAGDTADAISALLTPSGLPADLGVVGSFRIGVSQTALANYTLAVTPATLTVTAPQSAAPLPVQSPVTTGGAIGGLTPAASATPLVGGGPSAAAPTVFALTAGGATAGGTGTGSSGATASDTSGGGTAGGGPAAGSGGPASADGSAGAAVSTLSSGTGYSVNLLQVADTGAGSGGGGADTPASGTGDSPLFQSDSFNTGDDESQPGAETN